ncbi:MAG: T9SS type A sorting domain-containing protein [Saprospiraceae bacterium]|nr:T9SS type A sorting domain-containing protein [Saprospiraceae bacterium]
MNICKSLVLLLFSVSNTICFGQSYIVEIDSISYDTLIDYTSIVKENWDDRVIPPNKFDKEFDLGFDFPYFDTNFDKVYISNKSLIDFEGFDEYAMQFLVQLSPFYAVLDQPDVYNSDFRYKRDYVDNKSVFIIEFKNVDLFIEENTQVDLSFQFWLWENGNIEIRFGELNCPNEYFKPGFGVYDSFLNKYFTLSMTILSKDGNEIINVGGNINTNPIIHYNTYFDDPLGLTHLPAKNTVCRFRKKTTSTQNQDQGIINLPNLLKETINIPADIEFNYFLISDSFGRVLAKSKNRNFDISNLSNGVYFITFLQGSKVVTSKFLKI